MTVENLVEGGTIAALKSFILRNISWIYFVSSTLLSGFKVNNLSSTSSCVASPTFLFSSC